MSVDEKFWLKATSIPGSKWIEVSKEDWIKAERRAGFRPKLWSGHVDCMKICATGGFGDGSIAGSITTTGQPPLY
jgi:hypothetical protein